MFDSLAVEYGEVRGMLVTLAMLTFHDDEDISYTFDFTCLLQITLMRYLGDRANSVTLTPLTNWRQQIQEILKRWLFGQLALPGRCDDEWHKTIVEMLLSKIERLAQPIRAWKVDINPAGFYELQWEDVVLENEEAIFFLHMGFSD